MKLKIALLTLKTKILILEIYVRSFNKLVFVDIDSFLMCNVFGIKVISLLMLVFFCSGGYYDFKLRRYMFEYYPEICEENGIYSNKFFWWSIKIGTKPITLKTFTPNFFRYRYLNDKKLNWICIKGTSCLVACIACFIYS